MLTNSFNCPCSFLTSASLVKGYNRVELLKSMFLNKGTIFQIQTNTANLIAVDGTDDSLMSDYILIANTLIKINTEDNWRFYMNAIIDQPYYINYFNYSFNYPLLRNNSFGVYSISSKFVNSTLNLSRVFTVTDCKSFKP